MIDEKQTYVQRLKNTETGSPEETKIIGELRAEIQDIIDADPKTPEERETWRKKVNQHVINVLGKEEVDRKIAEIEARNK